MNEWELKAAITEVLKRASMAWTIKPAGMRLDVSLLEMRDEIYRLTTENGIHQSSRKNYLSGDSVMESQDGEGEYC
jgi:hypothetical protein